MEYILSGLIFLILTIVLISFINEKFIHIPNDIALVLFSFLFGMLLKFIEFCTKAPVTDTILSQIKHLNFEKFLMDGILCFMLFSGASGVHYKRFVKNLKSISLLALLSTLISSVLYGLLFFVICYILNINITIWICILLGCIVSPTDPIAATSILKKAGLSKNVSTIIEGESLFNDGTGVALFICIKNIITNNSDLSFPVLMAKELLGAIAIALILSFLLFELVKRSSNPILHIFISLLDVSLAYLLCEHLGCSGVIASVVCGLYFSRKISSIDNWRKVVDPKDLYCDFWHILDTLLNSILFILIGFSFMNLPNHQYLLILMIVAIILNFIARYSGVFFSGLIIGKRKIPNHYNNSEFVSLMTFSALKGGLSLALALSTSEFLPTPIYEIILIITYTTMFFTIVFQGLTIQKVFKRIELHKSKRMSQEKY